VISPEGAIETETMMTAVTARPETTSAGPSQSEIKETAGKPGASLEVAVRTSSIRGGNIEQKAPSAGTLAGGLAYGSSSGAPVGARQPSGPFIPARNVEFFDEGGSGSSAGAVARAHSKTSPPKTSPPKPSPSKTSQPKPPEVSFDKDGLLQTDAREQLVEQQLSQKKGLLIVAPRKGDIENVEEAFATLESWLPMISESPRAGLILTDLVAPSDQALLNRIASSDEPKPSDFDALLKHSGRSGPEGREWLQAYVDFFKAAARNNVQVRAIRGRSDRDVKHQVDEFSRAHKDNGKTIVLASPAKPGATAKLLGLSTFTPDTQGSLATETELHGVQRVAEGNYILDTEPGPDKTARSVVKLATTRDPASAAKSPDVTKVRAYAAELPDRLQNLPRSAMKALPGELTALNPPEARVAAKALAAAIDEMGVPEFTPDAIVKIGTAVLKGLQSHNDGPHQAEIGAAMKQIENRILQIAPGPAETKLLASLKEVTGETSPQARAVKLAKLVNSLPADSARPFAGALQRLEPSEIDNLKGAFGLLHGRAAQTVAGAFAKAIPEMRATDTRKGFATAFLEGFVEKGDSVVAAAKGKVSPYMRSAGGILADRFRVAEAVDLAKIVKAPGFTAEQLAGALPELYPLQLLNVQKAFLSVNPKDAPVVANAFVAAIREIVDVDDRRRLASAFKVSFEDPKLPPDVKASIVKARDQLDVLSRPNP
jgi:hypothetical protein